MDEHPVGSKVYGSKGSLYEHIAGEVRGSGGPCVMHGCGGERLFVRWPDGHVTKPCVRGLVQDKRKKRWHLG